MTSYSLSRTTRSMFTTLIVASLCLSAGCVTAPRMSAVNDSNGPQSRIPGALSLDEKFKKANSSYKDGMLVEAERWFLNIVADHPNLADAWFKLGNIYYRSGRYAAAVNAYEQVLTNDSSYEQAWYNLALTRVSQSVEVLDQSLPHIASDSPYFNRSITLKERLINRVEEQSNSPASEAYVRGDENRPAPDSKPSVRNDFKSDTGGQ